jgi:hypothetical protein
VAASVAFPGAWAAGVVFAGDCVVWARAEIPVMTIERLASPTSVFTVRIIVDSPALTHGSSLRASSADTR